MEIPALIERADGEWIPVQDATVADLKADIRAAAERFPADRDRIRDVRKVLRLFGPKPPADARVRDVIDFQS